MQLPDTTLHGDLFRPLALHIFDASSGLDHTIGIVSAAFNMASSYAKSLLAADAIDVLVINAPDDTIPEWGVGGYTYGPHVILLAVDPSFSLSQEHIERTLLHEFHHAMRWRGPGCGGDLAQMLISEGLAQLFEEEVIGTPPFFALTPVTDDEISRARKALHEEPFSQSKWFYGGQGITRSFGYAYGYELCKAYSVAHHERASQLVNTPARDIVDTNGLG